MGATQAKTVGSIIPHQRFTNSQYLPKQNIIIAHVNITKQSVVGQWSEKLNSFKKSNENAGKFLLLPLSYEIQDSKFCTFNSSVKMGFQNFPYVLEQEINNRTNMNRNFQQEEMWLLFYTLLSAHSMFAKTKSKVGDIHPHNIFINQQGYPKIACQLSWPQESTNFQKFYYEKNTRYLAPQQIYCCKQGLSANQTDPLAAQSFSIGVTMLHTGLLKDLSLMYNNNSYTINEGYLSIILNDWMNLKFNSQKNFSTSSYSPLLQNMVKNLCRITPSQRQSALSLYNTLKPYEDKILNLQSIPLNFANNSKTSVQIPDMISQQKFTNIENDFQQKKIPLNNQNLSVKFNYKSNIDSEEDKKYITLGKNITNNNPSIEYQKDFFMKYAHLHHGSNMQKPPQNEKTQIKASQIKEVFDYYADSHKHHWNNESQYNTVPQFTTASQFNLNSQFSVNKSQWNSNIPQNNTNLNSVPYDLNNNKSTNGIGDSKFYQNSYSNLAQQSSNTNQFKYESASDILKRIDQQIMKSRNQFG